MGWRRLAVWILLAATGLAAGCDETGEEGDDPTATALDPAPESIMEVTLTDVDGTTKEVRLPVNQLVVLLEESTSAAEASRTLEQMLRDQAGVGLRRVGEIPSLRIYQLELDNPHAEPQQAVGLLDEVLEAVQAYPQVASASYNSVYRFSIAENGDDNCDVRGPLRSAYSTIDYYQTAPVFDVVLGLLAQSPVVVGVIDSGIDLTSGQFDDIQRGGAFEFVSATSLAPVAADVSAARHGTAVCAIIAADNEDGASNGLALRALDSRLHLVVGAPATTTGEALLMSILATTKVAVNHGAQLVNLSLGDNSVRNVFPSLSNARAAFTRLAVDTPEVLYVVSAPNEPGLVVAGNAAPAGLPVDNILTVGGLDGFDFSVYPASAVAPGVDLAAPGVEVPTCCDAGNGLTYGTGNSFATPIVTSIAALVKSLAPSMTGAELKAFLLAPANTYTAPEAVGGRRPALLRTVANAILQRGSPGTEVREVLDYHNAQPPDGLADSPGLMISRLFSEADFSISGPGYERHYTQDPGDTDPATIVTATANYITPGQLQFWLAQDDDLLKVDLGAFLLGTPYTLSSSAGSRSTMLVVAGSASGDRFTGSAVSGTVTFSECEITTRSLPLDSFTLGEAADMIAIEVVGRIEGVVAVGMINSEPVQDGVRYEIQATFTKCFALSGPDEATLAAIEQQCIGGYQHFP
ncbi:MAG TPA: S8/S53 family peptidase [Myxococcota bacterium]|nr:S8/S53 family peptidase [Myxococcota bacterium]HRY97087.1 S8/S53 family peptidase [Myxococcota bacterium]